MTWRLHKWIHSLLRHPELAILLLSKIVPHKMRQLQQCKQEIQRGREWYIIEKSSAQDSVALMAGFDFYSDCRWILCSGLLIWLTHLIIQYEESWRWPVAIGSPYCHFGLDKFDIDHLTFLSSPFNCIVLCLWYEPSPPKKITIEMTLFVNTYPTHSEPSNVMIVQ